MAHPATLKSLLRKLPRKLAAGRIGVSTSTISRWLKKGTKIPEGRHAAILSVSDLIAAPKDVAKALELDAKALANLARVQLSTARKWKKKGNIPLRQRVFLLHTGPKEIRPRRLRTRIEKYESRFGGGTRYETIVNAINTAEVRLMLASWQTTIRERVGPHSLYQFVAEGTCIFEPNGPEIVGSSRLAFANNQEAYFGEVPWVSPGRSYFRKDLAFRDMIEELQDNEHITIFIEKVTCLRRTNIGAPRLAELRKEAENAKKKSHRK